jgi:hypothetical protein
VGLVLLLPDLARRASGRERAAICGMTSIAGFYGLLQVLRLSIQYQKGTNSGSAFSGLVLVTLLWPILRVLLRGADEPRLKLAGSIR